MTSAPYYDAALGYFAGGWRGILPLPLGRKTPPPLGYTGEKGLWPSRADIQAWHDGAEGAGNIALRLGPGELGVDVDAYPPKNGAETLAKYEALWGPLPPTWRSTSRDDGVSGIYLYRIPEGLRWPGELGPDTELIQYGHRYAVVAPSHHPTGALYRWISPDGTIGSIPPSPDDLPYLPDAWVAGITGGMAAEAVDRSELSTSQISSWLTAQGGSASAPCHRLDAALTRGLADLATGSRHAAGRATTLRLVRLVAEGHPGGLGAIDTFRTAFLWACGDVGRGARKVGEAEAEFASMLRSAVNVVTANPTVDSDGDPCDLRSMLGEPATSPMSSPPAPDARPATANSEPPSDPLYEREMLIQRTRRAVRRDLDNEELMASWSPPVTTSVADAFAAGIPVLTFRVADLWPEDSNVLLAAQYKTGKTTLINNLVKCLVDGDAFLGRFPTTLPDGDRIGLCNYEVGTGMYLQWLMDTGISRADRIELLNLRGHPMPFTVPMVVEWWVRWLIDHRITIWIVDPFGAAYHGDENSNTDVGAFLRGIDAIKERTPVREFMLVSHTGRQIFETGAEHTRGATRLDDWPDARWILTKDENDIRYFRADGRDVDVDEGALSYAGATRRLLLTGSSRTAAKAGTLFDTMMTAVMTEPGINLRDLRDRVRWALGKVGNQSIDKARDELVRRGKLIYVEPDRPGGAGSHYLSQGVGV